MEGFYRIPLYSNYMIDRQGIVFSYLSMGFLEGSINPAGYLHYRIKGDDGYVKTMGAHRLDPWHDGLICHYLFNH